MDDRKTLLQTTTILLPYNNIIRSPASSTIVRMPRRVSRGWPADATPHEPETAQHAARPFARADGVLGRDAGVDAVRYREAAPVRGAGHRLRDHRGGSWIGRQRPVPEAVDRRSGGYVARGASTPAARRPGRPARGRDADRWRRVPDRPHIHRPLRHGVRPASTRWPPVATVYVWWRYYCRVVVFCLHACLYKAPAVFTSCVPFLHHPVVHIPLFRRCFNFCFLFFFFYTRTSRMRWKFNNIMVILYLRHRLVPVECTYVFYASKEKYCCPHIGNVPKLRDLVSSFYRSALFTGVEKLCHRFYVLFNIGIVFFRVFETFILQRPNYKGQCLEINFKWIEQASI